VTGRRFGSAAAFSETARAYEATMALALAPVAAEVVRRAGLRPNETVLDIGTGTGTGARLALGDGRHVIGLDAAAGMLEIARRDVPAAEFIEADFTRIPLDDGTADAVLAVHALLFASDRVETLREWLRVTAAGGRLSLSVPGPQAVVPSAVFHEVYDRHGVDWRTRDYPEPDELAGWARDAGWDEVTVEADPTTAIRLADDDAFRIWMRVGRGTSDWDDERLDALGRDLMAICPREGSAYRIPFGTIYLNARRRG
jgi:SAM-dependent methyltransferase